MNPQLVGILNELWHMHHAQDFKLAASALLFITSFAAANMIFYDFVRGQRRKLAGTRQHATLLSLSIIYYLLATFGAVRTLDAMQDMAFLLLHPNALTTLSQRSVILEIPLLAVSLGIMVFIFFYMKTYLKLPYSKDRTNENSNFWWSRVK